MSSSELPRIPTESGQAGLAAFLAAPRTAIVASDFDGTLSAIVANPGDSRPVPGAIEVLRRLVRAVGRVVLITGRPVDSMRAIAGLHGDPELAAVTVLGHYGLERWDVGTDVISRPAAAAGIDLVREELPALVRDVAGVTIEDKHHSVAVHTRGAADPNGVLAGLRPALLELAARAGLEAADGRYVVELRPGGVDKGGTLRAFVAEAGASSVVFLGDDVGDLAAFAAIDAMRAEGTPGLKVASASAEAPSVAAAADVVVDGPLGIVAFLDALADAIAPRP